MLSTPVASRHRLLLATSLIAAAVLSLSSVEADARRAKDLAKGAAIGAGVGVLLDGSGGVLSGATAGILVAAISRRGRQ